MADVQWIKLYIDMFDKRKIKKLRRLPAGNELLLIWIMLLSIAGKCNAGGMIFITESVPFEEEDLADELGFEVNTIKLALNAFEELDMISRKDNGFINIVGWEEHQNTDKLAEIREQTRQRVAKCREKKRLTDGNVTGNVTVTDGNAIREERDKEKDKDKDLEIDRKNEYSFAQPIQTENDNFSEFSTELSTGEDSVRRALGGELGKGVVLLSDDQMSDLLEKLSIEEFDHYVGVVADCILKGKPFKRKTHYQAILDMAASDRRIR